MATAAINSEAAIVLRRVAPKKGYTCTSHEFCCVASTALNKSMKFRVFGYHHILSLQTLRADVQNH